MKAAGSASGARKSGKAVTGQDGAPTAPKARPFRLNALEPKEAQLQAAILDYLRVEQAHGRVTWFCRVNGGAMRGKGRQFVRNYRLYLYGEAERHEGYADLHGMLRGGRYFALEVKRPGKGATPEQATFLETVRQGGGIAGLVCHWEDVRGLLWGEVNPRRDQTAYVERDKVEFYPEGEESV